MTKKNIKKSHTKWTVPGIEHGKEYHVRVRAQNEAGVGPPSVPSKEIRYGNCN